MGPDVRTRLGVIAPLALAAALPLQVASSTPTPTGLEESAKVRLRSVRLRVEPTRLAPPGACLELGLGDLKVSLRGERLRDDELIELERERRETLHALLIDASGSMIGKLETVRSAAAAYVDQLRTDYERGLVASFDDSVVLEAGATSDRETLEAAIERVRMGSGTAMLDALYYSIHELDAHGERSVVVLLSDGMDTSSFHERADVNRLVEQRPELTVFTIGLEIPELRSGGPPGLLSAKRFLQNLARRSNGKFFDVPTASGVEEVYLEIREMLENEATLTFLDRDPDAELGRIRVSSTNRGCKVRAFRVREPDADPARLPIEESIASEPASLDFPPAPAYRKIYDKASHLFADPACGWPDPDEPDTLGIRWFVEVDGASVRGCGVDVTMERGMLYSNRDVSRTLRNAWLGLKTRPFEFALPGWHELPTGPEQLMDGLARFARSAAGESVETDPRQRPEEEHARPYHDYPSLNHGRTFLDTRPRLAHAMFARADYREWVRGKLEARADREMKALVERFRRYAPERSEAELREAARQSPEGLRIRARAETPSEVDLQGYLTAWLGDIAAHDLFVRWERLRIGRLLDGEVDGGFVEEWSELRRIFFVPSYARILTLLDPVYDPGGERVGFWRVVLPRPAWFLERVRGWKHHPEFTDLPLDLIPDRPLGFTVLKSILERDGELARHLRSQDFAVADVSYELLGKARKQDPRRAFREARVEVVLEAEGAPPDEMPRLRLTAQWGWDSKQKQRYLDRVEITAEGDPRLEMLAERVQRYPVEVATPAE